MQIIWRNHIRFFTLLFFSFLSLSSSMLAVPQGSLRGTVTDPLGAAVQNAELTLLRGDTTAGTASTDGEGMFSFSSVSPGRYHVQVKAPGFATYTGQDVFVGAGRADLDAVLQIGSLKQNLVVTATGTGLPISQVGASVGVVDQKQIDTINKLDVHELLRLVPGTSVQTGQHGAVTSLFIRGGEPRFNKVLVDGIPINDLGGDFDFGNFMSSGIGTVEVLSGPNSALYGTDAVSGVVSISTRRGTTAVPELSLAFDGGNFHTFHQEATLSGAFRRFDYFSDFSRFDSRNAIPNSVSHNGTFSGNFGWAPNSSTNLRATVRHTTTAFGSANAIDFYGIPDDSTQRTKSTYAGITVSNQTTARWHNLARLAFSQFRSPYINPTPTGISDAFGNYDGATVTIRGANGFSTTGMAVLDFFGTYPSIFESGASRKSVYAQSDFDSLRNLTGTFGFRYEHENGFNFGSFGNTQITRNNYSYVLEAHGNVGRRFYFTTGVGLEDNEIFGFDANPRVSLAYYLRQPSSSDFWGDTKLKFNFGKGIKEPRIFDQTGSLFAILSSLPGGAALISQFGVAPIGPERSRSFDGGVEQGLWNGRARLSLTVFHNRFFDIISSLGIGNLISIGVPAPVAQAVGFASVNAQSLRALGGEARFEADLRHGLLLQVQYTYLDSVVTRSFGSSSINPQFPGIPIGAFAPLQGNRPFRRPPHVGSVALSYSRGQFAGSFSGYFVSRSDDSTFLSDPFFRNTMLLPNHNLNPGYQKIDMGISYKINSYVTLYTTIENALNQHYTPAFGYPALPLTFRTGVKVTVGGEGWKRE